MEAYKAIPKTGRGVYIDKSKPVTPARLEQLEAAQWRQTNTVEYNAILQSLTQSGALTGKSLKRVRARERQAGRDFSMSDKNPLIAELDAHVSTAAKYVA